MNANSQLNITIVQKFKALFKTSPIVIESPGRINLIGEHTDYNDGYVMPAAIDKHIILAVQKNENNLFRFFSYDKDEYFETKEIAISNIDWANYLLGILAILKKKGNTIDGIDCVFGGNIPIGAGLSSSAALECGFTEGINTLFNLSLSKVKIAKISQQAEHTFVGVKCGIMDQFANMFGKKKHVLQLDCRNLDYTYLPLHLDNHTIMLCDTKVKHTLASSEYNLRRHECEKGVKLLQQHYKIDALRDVTPEILNKHKAEFDETVYKRCHYVIEENNRVIEASRALVNKDLKTLGKLMYASHDGLQNQYEVSCKELDFLVTLAKKHPDKVLGARMMGGGFGGCTINIVKKTTVDDFKKQVINAYNQQFGKKPAIYLTKINKGTTIV